MANQYLNYYNNMTSEHSDFRRSLIDETIERYGIKCFYLPRTTNNLDRIFGDDPTSTFESAYELTMLPENPEFFNSGDQMNSSFGFMSNFTYSLYIEMRRFSNMTEMDEPVEDDLLYIEIFDKWFKIKKSNNKEQFYYQGKLYVYKIEIEELKYSHEPISTNEPGVDDNLPVSDDEVNSDSDAIDNNDLEDNIIEEFQNYLNEE